MKDISFKQVVQRGKGHLGQENLRLRVLYVQGGVEPANC